ncbi:MAG: phosphoenolpyruvate--protein phosphotransferase, partial [Comamonadaceae bacterium]
VGLGVSSLSMAPSAIPAVRTSLLEHTIDECRSMAEAVLRAPDGRSARTVLKERQEAK